MQLEDVRQFLAVDCRLVVKDEWSSAVMPQSHTAAFFFGVKVEEVIGNVLMTFCDDCAATGSCGNVVMAVVQVI